MKNAYLDILFFFSFYIFFDAITATAINSRLRTDRSPNTAAVTIYSIVIIPPKNKNTTKLTKLIRSQTNLPHAHTEAHCSLVGTGNF